MTKHTSGPWVKRGNSIMTSDIPENQKVVCTITRHREVANQMTEGKANGHLVSAAPEMLEALEELVRLGTMDKQDSVANLALMQAEKAIAKAKGE